MYKPKQGIVVGRFIGVLCTVMMLVSGVTFAALQSQSAALKGSKITSATANLQIGDGQNGYGASTAGFEFNNVEPGGAPVPTPGFNVFLKNSGSSNLALKLAMNPNNILNPNSAVVSRIYVVITAVSGPNVGSSQQLPLSMLLSGYTNGAPVTLDMSLPAGQVGQYALQIQMAADAVSSTQSGVTLSGIDLIFSGTSIV